jgi:hypothetical protein
MRPMAWRRGGVVTQRIANPGRSTSKSKTWLCFGARTCREQGGNVQTADEFFLDYDRR